MRAMLLFFTLILVIFPGNGHSLERFDIMTTEEMEEMLHKRKNGHQDFILVNALDEMIYRNSHIPGSINIPLGKIEENSFKLGADRSKPIVTY